MDPQLKYYVVLPLSILWAFVSIHGGKQGWRCLTDPPASLRILSSHPWLTFIFGARVVKNVTVATGWIALAIAFYVAYYA